MPLVRIGLEVIEGIEIPDAVVVDVLVAVSSQGEERGRGRKVPLPVVLVEEMIPPAGRRLPAARGEEGQAAGAVVMGLGRCRDAQRREDRGSDVDVEQHRLDPPRRGQPARRPGHERHPDRGLKGIPLVVEAVLAEVEAVVAHVDHKCVVGEARLVKCLKQPADVFVDAMDALGVAMKEGIEIRHWILVEGAGLHVVDAVNRVATLADPVRLGAVVPLGAGPGLRPVDWLAVVAAAMPGRGLEGIVNGLEREGEAEPLGRIAAVLEPLPGEIGQHVGCVAREGLPLAVDVELRIEVDPLAAKRGPVVEAGPGGVVVVAHVPLADEGGLNASRLEVLREKPGARGHGPLIVHHAVVVHVLPGQDRGPTRRAERGGHEGIGEMNALAGEPVEVGRLEPFGGVGVEAEKVVAVVVGEDEDHIPGQRLSSQCRRADEGRGSNDQKGGNTHDQRICSPAKQVKEP